MAHHSEMQTIEVWTEGKTDWIHLTTAMQKLGIQLPITFHKDKEPMGDENLKRTCEIMARRDNTTPIVFIFDRDNEKIIRAVSDSNNPYKSWGNNVYSFVIPEPDHRKGFTNISIELFYTDDELCLEDSEGRRLFLTSEFNERSGKLKANKLINIGNKGKLSNCTGSKDAKIVADDVYNEFDENIALSKIQFAEYLQNNIPPFDNFNFSPFKPIFNILSQIFRASSSERNVYLPNFQEIFEDLQEKPTELQVSILLDKLRQVMVLGMQTFAISTIRVYEEAIINEPPEYRRKVIPIKSVLKENFFSPSFKSFCLLAEKCFYLVDETAPKSLQEMKLCFDKTFELGPIGQVLDELELLFPPAQGVAIQTHKAEIQRSLISYVFKELAKYDKYSLADLEKEAESLIEKSLLSIDNWQQAILQIIEIYEPILTRPVQLRSLEYIDANTNTYTVEIKTYTDESYSIKKEQISSDEAEEYQTNYSQLVLAEQLAIHLFPLLLIKENALYFYQRSRASGYEYYSLVNDKVHIESTKRRFNQAIFKTGSTQEFFWTDVLPTVNPQNGIRANIPQEGLDEFVGRVRQKRLVHEQIIEIPNRDGIVFGPGGIGKTALLQQLTQEMYENINDTEIYFDNIIWVSAKRDYYDHIFGVVEQVGKYSNSLDDILTAILQFFEFGDLYEYDLSEKKELVFEVLQESKTLLILDNFETLPEGEANKIRNFFGTEIKRKLRHCPDNFKVIITSRKQIPSGFYQIQLKGLDLKDSRNLMRRLQERYHVQRLLSDDQEKEIHEATQGIPIVIKHCFGQLFEYNQPHQAVLRELTLYKSNIVQFSYKEILNQVEKRDSSGVQLKILLLLEILKIPLLIRQIAEIIKVSEVEIEEKLPTLVDFQCIQTIYQNGQEKYVLNDEIKMLAQSLERNYADDVKLLRARFAENSVEHEIEATSEELYLAKQFEHYLSERRLLEAEDFIREQLEAWPESTLLNYHNARYLAEKKQEYEKAIKILDKIREASGNHPKILSLLVICHTLLPIPRYQDALPYVNELEIHSESDPKICMQIASYYIDWSSQIKSRRKPDPIEEQLRQQKYKDLARKALDMLNELQGDQRTDKFYYLCAKCYYNLWKNDKAIQMLDRAIEKSDTPKIYDDFRNQIRQKEQFHLNTRFSTRY